MQKPIFRRELATSRSDTFYGHVLLLQPLSFKLLTGFFVLVAVCAIAFISTAQYTKRVQTIGQIVPDLGLLKIQSPQTGIIVESRIEEGQKIHKGDVLFVVSSDLTVDDGLQKQKNGTKVNSAILDSLRESKSSINQEKQDSLELVELKRTQLKHAIESIQEEQKQSDQEIGTQKDKLLSLESRYRQYQELAKQRYISELALQQKYDEVVDQKARLQVAQRGRISLSRELQNTQSELGELSFKNRQEQEKLGQQILDIDQKNVAVEERRQILITAPQDGTIGTILVSPGQIATNQVLATIFPANAQMEGLLYVSSRSIGSIEAGQSVVIRYPAFPYQKFGQFHGTVKSISRNSLTAKDLPDTHISMVSGDGDEAVYRVRIALDEQDVHVGGKHQALFPGMQFNADILQSSQSIAEWLFEPIISRNTKV